MPPSVWGYYVARLIESLERQGRPIYNRRAFEDAVAADGLRRLAALAETWWHTWELTPWWLADCLVDETPPRYARRKG